MGDVTFGPTVDNITVFSDYPARYLAGQFSKIPMVVGINDNEAGLFALQAAQLNVSVPSSSYDKINLVGFNCPSGLRSNVSVSAGMPTWRYRYFGEFPNTKLTTSPDLGAWHESEIAVLFDTLPTGHGIPASTSEELAIGKYLRGAWAAFAKNTTGGLLTYGGGWPTYNPEAATLIRLGYNNLTGTNAALPALYDANCTNTFEIKGAGSNVTNPTQTQTQTPTPTGTGAVASQSSNAAAASGPLIKTFSSIMFTIVTMFIIGIIL
jgi:carboxylesterase type B